MNMNERIKKARKDAGFRSQEKFADYIGTTRDTIATYELGRVVPNDVFLQLMAAKLNISYEWLKYGTGEQTAPVTDAERVAGWVQGIFDRGSDFERRFVSALSKFDANDWRMLEHIIDTIIAENAAALDATARAEKEKQLAAAEKQAAALRVELGIAANSEPRREQGKTREEWHQYIDEIFDGEKEDGYSSNSQDFDDATKIKRRAAR